MRVSHAVPLAVALLLASVAGSVAAKGTVSDETAQRIHDYVVAVLDELEVPGAAVVVVGVDGIEYEEGFGVAGPDGTPVTPQTPFHIASLSKQLTSIAVMQLIQSGDLELDKPVHSYVPWFGTDGSETARITVRDLLAQTSGWTQADGLANRIDGTADDAVLERNVRRLADTPPSHPLGQFEYSNANYDVLGYLVAVATGTSYEAYMAENVFAPLGMTDTFTDEAAAEADGLAQGYYPFFGFPVPYDIPFVRGSVPSSFIAASAEDLGHVLSAHLNDGTFGDSEVLPPAAMSDLRRPLIHPDSWNGYGWGWWSYPLWEAGRLVDGQTVSQYELPVMLEHPGSHATYASGMALLPEEGIGVVVLLNLNDEAAPSRFYQIHPGILQIVLGLDPPALTSNDDPLSKYGKALLGGAVLLMAAGVAVALRRLRRWQRDPDTSPRGRRGVIQHLVLPLTLDLGVTALAWWLVLDRSPIGQFDIVLRLAPDVGLSLIMITVLGAGWGLLRTVLTLRVLRGPAPHAAEPVGA